MMADEHTVLANHAIVHYNDERRMMADEHTVLANHAIVHYNDEV